jgi:hypothetical protein
VVRCYLQLQAQVRRAKALLIIYITIVLGGGVIDYKNITIQSLVGRWVNLI